MSIYSAYRLCLPGKNMAVGEERLWGIADEARGSYCNHFGLPRNPIAELEKLPMMQKKDRPMYSMIEGWRFSLAA